MVKGIIIGALLGILGSIGYLNMNVKKSQRGTMFPIIAVALTVAGAIAGGRIGYNIDRSARIDRSLGLDAVLTNHIKTGRFWNSESSWTDCQGHNHILNTVKKDANVISVLDGKNLCSHGTSASSVNIQRYHKEIQNEVFKQIRNKHGEDMLKIHDAHKILS